MDVSFPANMEYCRLAEVFRPKLYNPFISRLEQSIRKIREEKDSIHVQGCDCMGILPHAPDLCPHWQAFADAIIEKRSGDFRSNYSVRFIFQNIAMPKEVLRILQPALIQKKDIQLLAFDNTFFGRDGLLFLAEILSAKSKLRRLSVTNGLINDLEAARTFSRALSHHNHLRILALSDCNLGETPEILSTLLDSINTKTMDSLEIENNSLDSRSAPIISRFLAANPPLQNIDLSSNEFNNDDAISLARALRTNTNLKTITLLPNNFEDIGKDAFREIFYDDLSLNAVSECNHTCRVSRFWEAEGSIYDNKARSSKLNRRKKIYHALCQSADGRFNLQLIDNVPLYFIPDVLCLLQHNRSKKSNCLGKMFDVLRFWKNMPTLYASAGSKDTEGSANKRRKTE